jgi:hypothetical protein
MLLLIGLSCVAGASFQLELGFYLPRMLCYVEDIQVLMSVVPADNVQESVIVKYIVAE